MSQAARVIIGTLAKCTDNTELQERLGKAQQALCATVVMSMYGSNESIALLRFQSFLTAHAFYKTEFLIMEISIVIPTFQTTLGKNSVIESIATVNIAHHFLDSMPAYVIEMLTLQCHQHLHQAVTQTLSECLCADLTLLGQELQRTLTALHESHSVAVIWT